MAALDSAVSQMQTEGLPGAPRRWNKGVWIRFALAITPTVVFAILGYLQTH